MCTKRSRYRHCFPAVSFDKHTEYYIKSKYFNSKYENVALRQSNASSHHEFQLLILCKYLLALSIFLTHFTHFIAASNCKLFKFNF